MDMTQYYIVLGLNLLAGVLWLVAALAALSGYRAFRQRADLAWLGAFIALAFATLNGAAGAWRAANGAMEISSGAELYAEMMLPSELRLGALMLIAALLAMYAFVQRRSL